MWLAAKSKGLHLSDLVRDGDVDMAAVQHLLKDMQSNSKPVNPHRLGVIGEEHLKRYFDSLGAKGFRYIKKAFIDDDELPVLLEIAFANKAKADETARRIIGLNWSPIFKIPSGAIADAISECQVETDDPVIYFIHVARPRFEFTDHSKGSLS